MKKFLMTSLAAVLTLALAFAPVPAMAQAGGVQNPTFVLYVTGAAYTNATTTFSNVVGGSGNGLTFGVGSGQTYSVTCYILWQGSAATTGPKYQWTGPAAPTAVAAAIVSQITTANPSTYISASAVAFSTSMPNTGTITTATNQIDLVTLAVVNGVNAGTITLQAAANGAGTLTIQPGSKCLLQ